MHPLSTVAVFDFDNTITDRDSLLPFLFYVKGFWKTLYHLTVLIPSFVLYLFGGLSRQEIKEKIITRFWGGRLFSQVQTLGDRYANGQLDRYVKPQALERLRWHLAQGDRCLLVSASFEFYLKPWAVRHGFEKVIASRLELTSSGIVTGRLEGKNCWGPEKEFRLKEYLGEATPVLYAYGDSRGDQEMLAMANHPFYRTF